MTRKDYICIAEVLKNYAPQKEWKDYEAQKSIFCSMCESFARCLKNDNPRFDYSRFYNACGYDEVSEA